jgi:hypothetical protein
MIASRKENQPPMEGIQSWAPTCARPSDPPAFDPQGQSARLSCLNACQEQSAEITIVTDEGDKVMLSAHEHFEATLLTYEHLAYRHAGYEGEQMQLADFTMEHEIALAIEGELNEQEIADIQALLRDLGGTLQTFLTGKGTGDGSPATAGDLSRFSSISAFEADFESRISMQYLQVAADRMAAEAPVRLQLADPAARAAAPIPPSGPEPKAAALTAATLSPHRGDAEQMAAKMAKRVNESGLPPGRLLKLLKKFMKSVLKELLANQTIDGRLAQRGENVLERFIDEVRKSAGAVEVRGSRVSMNLLAVSSLYEAKAELKLQPAVAETA